MNCRNCGAPLEPGARFCRKCGTDVQAVPLVQPRTSFFSGLLAKCKTFFSGLLSKCKAFFDRPFFRNKKLLAPIGAGAAVLLLVLILILSIASCSGQKLRTPEDAADAVLSALEKGDGDRLLKLTALSETVCGAHPELFGEGDTPHEVMQNYYRTLAGTHCTQWKETYGKGFSLKAQLARVEYTDTDVFEINRALDLDAAKYAILKGPLLVNDETVGSISITVVEWDGEWHPLVVYLY